MGIKLGNAFREARLLRCGYVTVAKIIDYILKL